MEFKAELLRLVIILTSYSVAAFAALWKFISQKGAIGHNWDWSIPPLPIQLRYLADKSFYVWSETSFGGPAAAQIHFRFLSLFLGNFGHMDLTGDFVSKFLVFLIIVLSGTSMFYLVHDILEKEIKQLSSSYNVFFPSLLAGYFYALSPFIFADIIGGAYTQLFAYSIIPAVLYSFRKMVFSETKLKNILLLTIFLSLLSVSSSRFVLAVIILLLYASVQSKRIKALKGLLLSFLLYIPVNSYWIIPSLYEFATGTSTMVVSPQLIYLPNILYAVPSMMEIFVGVGYFRPFFVWVLEKTILPIWAIISFSFLACILTFVLFHHKTKEALFWVMLYISSLAIVTVGKSPISGLILWMYMNIPLMLLYRSPQHLLILTTVPLSIILGIGAFALSSFINKRTARSSSTIKRKTLTASLIVIMFISASIWVSPFFTGNLGADYLRDKGEGNYVNTFELSPDLVIALETIYNESDKDVFRTLFLPPASSPYYLETHFQKEGQGVDVVVGSTPRGVSDASSGYNEPIVTFIRDSFLEGTFKDPWLLEVANIRYIILRNDVNPLFGPKAHIWNFTRTLSNLKEIEDLKLIYEGQHVSLWEYENHRPLIYPTKKLINIPEKYSALLFSPTTELISIRSKVLDDFENSSELTKWFTFKNFEQNLTLDSLHVVAGNYSLKISYNITSGEGGVNLNYFFEKEENISEYRWVSAWLYYPEPPPPNTYAELYLFDASWTVLHKGLLNVTQSGWNHLIYELDTRNSRTVKFLRFQFYNPHFVNATTTINLDDIELLSFRREHGNIPSSPVIHFKQINPTRYTIHISNATEPFFLIFSETYDPSWKVYEGSVNWLEAIYSKPLAAKHFYINGYANAWYVNKTGTYTITLEFLPQKLFYIGSAISLTMFIFSVFYIGKDKIKVLYIRYAKKKQ